MLNTRAKELLSQMNSQSDLDDFIEREQKRSIKRMREAAKKRKIYSEDLNFYGRQA